MKRLFRWLSSRPSRANVSRPKNFALPQIETLEGRCVPATLGATKWGALDFDGEYLSSTDLSQGGWNMTAKSLGSFHSLFTAARPWLDMNGDALVNGTDANLAINSIMNKVWQDFRPYKVSVFQGDQDDYQSILTDGIVGDVLVMITSTVSTDVYSPGAWGVAPAVDVGNDSDEIVFVFAGDSVDFFAWDRDGWFNQVARTISHEMGHAFGLDHEESDGGQLTDFLSHSMMGTPNRDWSRDFVFQDRWFNTDSGSQNAHQHLLREDILGRSYNSYMAVLTPGVLTISGNYANNNLQLYQGVGNRWDVYSDGTWTSVDLQSLNVNSLNPFDAPITSVRILGEGGNDYIYVSVGFNALTVIYAGEGNDTVYGGYGTDVIFGEGGVDYIYGRDGIDYLYGGNDTDYIYGGNHNDYLFGEGGLDYLYGEGHNDYLSGGSDGYADYLNGGSGADRFAAEWYWKWSGWLIYQANRDNPADFNSGQGDTIV